MSNRFDRFTPQERIVMKQALQELAEDDDDPGTSPWAEVAEELFNEVKDICRLAEQEAADGMNAEGERRENE